MNGPTAAVVIFFLLMCVKRLLFSLTPLLRYDTHTHTITHTHTHTQSKAKQSKAKQSKAKQSKAKQSKSKVYGYHLGHTAWLPEPGFLCATQDHWARADKSS